MQPDACAYVWQGSNSGYGSGSTLSFMAVPIAIHAACCIPATQGSSCGCEAGSCGLHSRHSTPPQAEAGVFRSFRSRQACLFPGLLGAAAFQLVCGTYVCVSTFVLEIAAAPKARMRCGKAGQPLEHCYMSACDQSSSLAWQYCLITGLD